MRGFNKGGYRRLAGILIAACFLSGCNSDWEKVLIRKRVKPPALARFDVGQDARPYPELYKEHFVFWRNWHREILQDLGDNRKQDLNNIREARRHLIYLEKYLAEDQARKVRPMVEQFDQLTEPIRNSGIMKTDYGILLRRLESFGLNVERSLHYKKMKDMILPTPLPLNMENYQGEEPVIPALTVKTPPPSADSGKDGKPAKLTYEQYRTAPVS